jgi:hypothetical protein
MFSKTLFVCKKYGNTETIFQEYSFFSSHSNCMMCILLSIIFQNCSHSLIQYVLGNKMTKIMLFIYYSSFLPINTEIYYHPPDSSAKFYEFSRLDVEPSYRNMLYKAYIMVVLTQRQTGRAWLSTRDCRQVAKPRRIIRAGCSDHGCDLLLA